ncbi:enoyl-CoA hydratase [Agilicoccus flavus]|uniref:enoyl-CoA hydratase n=1 Tax=Agilicoccus flavus TaxID=2775968 RepID=UPI001CF6A821|nr:enoyl-CoA hydratase [Agilicoccus flavus]
MTQTPERAGYDHIRVAVDGAVATVTMNRPTQRNALSLAHMRELVDAFEGLGADRSVRAVILAGEGPAFCAGHDLKEMIGRDAAFYDEVFDVCVRLMSTIRSIPQPVVAAVHALATAAGCQLAATCDLVVAADTASFATPGVRIGLFCSTPMVALSRAVGQKTAMRMLLTGEPLDAQGARAAGLVTDVVPAAELPSAARSLADRIAEASGVVVGIGKEAFYRQAAMDTDAAYAYAKGVMTHNAGLADAQEGMTAFAQKRPPAWSDR